MDIYLPAGLSQYNFPEVLSLLISFGPFLLCAILFFYVLFSVRRKIKKIENRVDIKIKILEDLSDKVEAKLSEIPKSNILKMDRALNVESGLGAKDYQNIVQQMQRGVSVEELSKQTGTSEEDLKVLAGLISLSQES